MKLLHQCFLFGALTLGMASCASEAPWGSDTDNGVGSIQLNFTASDNLIDRGSSTRAEGDAKVIAPPSSEFSISVRKLDGTFQKTYTKLEDFLNEKEFAVGSYELDAFYGSPSSQGVIASGEIGYEHTYFFGTSDIVTVVENKTTEVNLVASLANSAVKIEYTENFKGYFKQWSTTLTSDNHTPVPFGNSENIGFVTPGKVAVIISAVLQNGKQLSLSPAAFVTQACHLYKVKYDINKGDVSAVPQLVIKFEGLTGEDVSEITVDLTEQLVNAGVPVITSEAIKDAKDDYNPSDIKYLTVQNGAVSDETKARFSVFAGAGLKTATLSVDSKISSSSIPVGTFDLITFDAATLRQMGIDARGFAESERMANLDITKYLSTLSAGSYSFTLNATDDLGQAADPETLTVDVIDTNTSISSATSTYGTGYALVTIGYDGPAPTSVGNNPFSFQIIDDRGVPTDVDVIAVNETPLTKAYTTAYYVYQIAIPETLKLDGDSFGVNVLFGNSKKLIATTTVNFDFPNYEVETDAFAKSIRLRLISDSESEENRMIANKSLIYKRLKIYVDGKEVTPSVSSDHVYTISGLTPSSSHTITTSLKKSGEAQTTETVPTEAATDVPNGDFSSNHVTIEDNLQVGGPWRAFAKCTTTCDMEYSEPNGWASINAKTFYTKSSSRNTWFVVASTYLEAGNIVIRSVAYDHAGTTPSESGGATLTSYCTNRPSSIANTAAGEFFLGSYSYDSDSEVRKEGTSFVSRPMSLSFEYKYDSYNDDNGLVEVELLSEDNISISKVSRNLTSANSMTPVKIDLSQYLFGIKASTLRIKFVSSTKSPVETREISSVDLSLDSKTAGGKLNDKNSTHTFCYGSVLTISPLNFEY